MLLRRSLGRRIAYSHLGLSVIAMLVTWGYTKGIYIGDDTLGLYLKNIS